MWLLSNKASVDNVHVRQYLHCKQCPYKQLPSICCVFCLQVDNLQSSLAAVRSGDSTTNADDSWTRAKLTAAESQCAELQKEVQHLQSQSQHMQTQLGEEY